MLLSRILFAVLFVILLQCVIGIEKRYPFSDDEDYSGASGGPFSDDEDNISEDNFLGNAMNNDTIPDIYATYSDGSFYHELATLTSNGVIKVTIDVMLLSAIQLVGLANITITGHDSPTVNCDNAGGLYFDNCHNCTLIGIIWEKCGTENDRKPAIKLCNSSNILIQNCSFQHSVAQAIALSEMSGKIIINGCKFLFNYFKGHGTAIYYLANNKHLHSKFQFTITDCNFTNNGIASDKSIVYIGSSSNRSVKQMYFMNSVFSNNQGVPLYITYQAIIVNGNIVLKGNVGYKGGAICITKRSKLVFYKSDIKFDNNKALYQGGALYIDKNSFVTFEENSTLIINNNQAKGNGGALYIEDNCNVTFKKSSITINNNQAKTDGGAFYIESNSNVTFEGNYIVTINNNQAKHRGGALFIFGNSNVTFNGNSTITINSNRAKVKGGALAVFNNSDITFKGNCTVTFNNNQANNGGALYISESSNAMFERNFAVTINNNLANNYGGALCIAQNSAILFEGNWKVTINNNQAKVYGGALGIVYISTVTFKGNSTVTVNNNLARRDGGALYIEDHSNVKFEGIVTIKNNQANKIGGAFCVWYNSNVQFEGHSTVKLNNNIANISGGTFSIQINSNVIFKENSTITINNNQAAFDGGALYVRHYSDVIFQENSIITINNNQAMYDGGALHTWENCDIIFKGNSVVTVHNNAAKNSGGALLFSRSSNVLFEEDSLVKFYNNTAGGDGGALYGQNNCSVKFKDNSIAMFSNNEALNDGGAVCSISDCHIAFQENSTVKFYKNKATYFGGALRSTYNSEIMFENNCMITFTHNQASQGGAIFVLSNTVFRENSTVKFDNNKATIGGALHISNVTFKDNTVVTFNNNEAVLNGGALSSDHSHIMISQNCKINFTNNSAENGGAVFTSASTLLVSEYSNVTFNKNIAGHDSGGIHFDELISAVFKDASTFTIVSNTANNYGGAIYIEITQNTKHFMINGSEINFSDNIASVAGNLLYIDVPKSCNVNCLSDRIVGISNDILQHGPTDKKIATSPRTLKLHYPAKCISNDSIECIKYYIDNIMLGQEISFPICLLDYYNQPAEVTQFKIIGEDHQNYSIHGSEYTSISCNHTFEGISIIGNRCLVPLNFSLLFTSNGIKSERKNISVNLTVGLSPCHPGFQYNSKSQKCECYNKTGIVYCSGSSSTIKRGYWFGHVTGIPTVTFCPISYCNFTCCKTTNGYYDLSPERVNQCRSKRSGIACGSCEEGHTLSFNSAECININKCFTGQTILVVSLTILYWFAVVVTVFFIKCYRVKIGYFYAITYYYSLVDILLSQHADQSNGLHITLTIMSSIAKVTPRFLGKLCLFENMSGIDQQFIHYTHPLAILVILIIISWLARHFKKLSTFISRGIIHAICFLLLLSYTSVATTSLLLMRSLTFVGADNVYTYLSPNIQYFHGRHLVYGIFVIILTLLIVIGLPLLLLLEPFLNCKITFYRIQPLLDQFQGCYKDKYRYFAAYYMICRLMIITIVIANLSEAIISQYILITINTIIALIHIVVRPYANNILNISDGAILYIMVLVTGLPLFEYYDTSDSSLVLGIAFVLVILPLIQFIGAIMFISKQSLKEIIMSIMKTFSLQDKTHTDVPNSVIATNTHVDLIIDESMRTNSMVIEMYVSSCINMLIF